MVYVVSITALILAVVSVIVLMFAKLTFVLCSTRGSFS